MAYGSSFNAPSIPENWSGEAKRYAQSMIDAFDSLYAKLKTQTAEQEKTIATLKKQISNILLSVDDDGNGKLVSLTVDSDGNASHVKLTVDSSGNASV